MKHVQDEYALYFQSLGLKESQGKQAHIILSKDKEADNDYPLNPEDSEINYLILTVINTDILPIYVMASCSLSVLFVH